MSAVDEMTDEQVDQVLEQCMNLENEFYKKGWDEGIAKVNEEALEGGKQYGKLYGCAVSSVIHYCKSILATLVRDAVGDSANAVSQAKKQSMRTLIIRIEKMEADQAYDQTNIVSMVKQFNLLVEKAGLPALMITIPEGEDMSF
ncbi:hypothetical protein WA171_000329 [Blastocystis sp. BT1]